MTIFNAVCHRMFSGVVRLLWVQKGRFDEIVRRAGGFENVGESSARLGGAVCCAVTGTMTLPNAQNKKRIEKKREKSREDRGKQHESEPR